MSNKTVSRLGQNNLTGDARANFLKIYSGEVLTAFEALAVTPGKFMTRTLTEGKSASFPVMGRASGAFYHVPGNEILGGQIAHGERIINIDGLLVHPWFIANIDEAMNHYEVRGHYSSESGRVLAEQWDRHVLQTAILAARTSTAAVTGLPVGSTITEAVANDFNDSTKVIDALFEARTLLSEKKVPQTECYAFIDYRTYYRLVKDGKLSNRDFGGLSNLATGTLNSPIAGLEIVPTYNLPTTNIVASTVAGGELNGYVGDFTKTFAVVAHKSALGTVKLLDLASEMEYLVANQGTLGVSKYAVGHGVLRPESAVELRRF